MIGVGAVEFEFSLERHGVCQTAFETFLDGVAWRVDVIVEELEHEVIASVGYREVFGKDLVKTFIVAFFRGSVELEEVVERLELHFKEVRVRKRVLYRSKIYAWFSSGD